MSDRERERERERERDGPRKKSRGACFFFLPGSVAANVFASGGFYKLRPKGKIVFKEHFLKLYNSFIEMQCTDHTIHPFKVQNSMAFSISAKLCNHRIVMSKKP